MSLFAITFLVNIVTAFFKKYIFPRWGRAGVQAILFVFAVIGAIYYQYLQHIPSVAETVGAAIVIFSMAIAIYEVLLSRFSFFQSPDANTVSST